MTLELAREALCIGEVDYGFVLRSYALHVATVARPGKLTPSPGGKETEHAITRNTAISDYFAAIKSEIEKN